MRAFDRAFDMVIGHEGGYVNDPRDPGGETKFGISKRAYPDLNIAGLTVDDARAIYRRDYWDAVKGDQLPESLAICLFDSAVNQGVKPAVAMLQRALGVTDDGVIGPATIAAAQKKNGVELVCHFMAERAVRYTASAAFQTYGRGWMRRLFLTAAEVLP